MLHRTGEPTDDGLQRQGYYGVLLAAAESDMFDAYTAQMEQHT